MFNRVLLGAALGMTAAAAFLPSAASAQRYDPYPDPRYSSYGYYGAPIYARQGYDEDRRETWRAHERWEERGRWEREEARRRYWRHERREHEQRWRDDDDRR